jgi:hypothetical protein
MSHSYDHQTHYQSLLGTASLDKKSVVAGAKTSLTLRFIVGTHGIDETGALKVLFRIASDMGTCQFSNAREDNYVSATCSNKSIILRFSNQTTGCRGKQYVRPWSQGFSAHITGGYLKKGDVVCFQFSNLRMQTYAEKNFECRVAVDAFATGEFLFLKKSPSLTILPDKPSSLQVILPTTTHKNTPCTLFAKAEDKWGNVCSNFSGKISLIENTAIVGSNVLDLKYGVAQTKVKIVKNGVHTIAAKLGTLHGTSNPTLCTETAHTPYLWADLHGQSNETVGTNTVNDYYNFARRYAHLDVTCHQGNDFQISNDFWQIINTTAKKHNKDGAFVAFPGYEWSGNTSVGGDHNVIYKKDNMHLYRSSHALVKDLRDIETDAPHIRDLYKKLDHKNAFTIAHVGGRYANIAEHADSSQLDAVEIHSDWGTFEWILQDAFTKGLRVGVVANSDGHKGTPGSSYPGTSHFGCQGGLTCIRAAARTRDAVFEALQAHHTYATTGARIMLDVQLTNDAQETAMLGDSITVTKPSLLQIVTLPTAPLERVEVYKKDVLIETFTPKISQLSPKRTPHTLKYYGQALLVRGVQENMTGKAPSQPHKQHSSVLKNKLL